MTVDPSTEMMSDAPARLKWDGQERPVSKSGESATAKRPTSLRRAAWWNVHGSFRAGCLKVAQSKSGIFAHLRDVFGRRRTTTTRDEY